MTKQLKIDGNVIEATEFAWDGCHKIYLIATLADRATMIGFGYEGSILPVSELPRVWQETCPLRFISSADLNDNVVSQFEDAEVTYT
jgi:hypothetical protein